jgi:hypothetical protein
LKLLAALFALMLSVGAVTLWLWRRSPEPEPCHSRTVAQSRSPDDRSDAEIYELTCGASRTTHVALRPAMSPPKTRADVLVVEGTAPVRVTWTAPREISIDAMDARILVTETRWRDVSVKLRTRH